MRARQHPLKIFEIMAARKPAKGGTAGRREAAASRKPEQSERPVISRLARAHAEAALAALIEVMGDRSAAPAARISAAGTLLNWGFGKAGTGSDDGGGPTELVIRWQNGGQNAPQTPPARSKS